MVAMLANCDWSTLFNLGGLATSKSSAKSTRNGWKTECIMVRYANDHSLDTYWMYDPMSGMVWLTHNFVGPTGNVPTLPRYYRFSPKPK